MNDAIIGGVIAAAAGAVFGIVTSLCLERRREKAKRLTVVEAILTETVENLKICKSPKMRKKWWLSSFKLEAYHAYKGQILFLPLEVVRQLVAAAIALEAENVVVQMHQSRHIHVEGLDRKSKSLPEDLTKQLEFVKDELIKWRAKNTLSLVFRVRRRLRNFVSQNRKNSKLNHS
jgi:uncharacterized membrane protein YbaN (DUF454 family)